MKLELKHLAPYLKCPQTITLTAPKDVIKGGFPLIIDLSILKK